MNDATALFSRTLQTMSSSLERLHPDPRNPRIHSPRQIKQIAKSIQAFGFNVPILVDRGGKILAGHGRYLAAQQLGLSEIPVIQLEHLSGEQARAFAIADNKLTENASWNDTLLGEIFADLASLDLSFDLEVTGFSMGEIDLRIESLDGATASPDAAETVDLPDPAQTAITQPGDLWELDGHRILCANALEAAAYEQLLQGQQAGVVFSDPPFNVPIDHHVTGNGKTQHREFAMASGEMSSAQFTQFLHSALAQLAAHSRNGSIHFICMDWRHLPEILSAGGQVYTELKNLCVWVKDKGGMGSFYRSQHELILVFKNGTGGSIKLFTGSIANSTGLASLASTGSESYYRYHADETTDFSTGSWLNLTSGKSYVMYREQPTVTVSIDNKTITYSDADPTWTFGFSGSSNSDSYAQAFASIPTVSVGGTTSTAGKYTAGSNPKVKNGKCWAYDISQGHKFEGGQILIPIGGKEVHVDLKKHYTFNWVKSGDIWSMELEGLSN